MYDDTVQGKAYDARVEQVDTEASGIGRAGNRLAMHAQRLEETVGKLLLLLEPVLQPERESLPAGEPTLNAVALPRAPLAHQIDAEAGRVERVTTVLHDLMDRLDLPRPSSEIRP